MPQELRPSVRPWDKDASMADLTCTFCDLTWMRRADVFIENAFCVFVSSEDVDTRARARLCEGVLPGSGVIVPIAHRTSPFDLNEQEWAATRELLLAARKALHDLLAPDGYTLGWNAQDRLHAHLHVLPRFDDEPVRNSGVRSGINAPENRRPDPYRPGSGRALLSRD